MLDCFLQISFFGAACARGANALGRKSVRTRASNQIDHAPPPADGKQNSPPLRRHPLTEKSEQSHHRENKNVFLPNIMYVGIHASKTRQFFFDHPNQTGPLNAFYSWYIGVLRSSTYKDNIFYIIPGYAGVPAGGWRSTRGCRPRSR